MRKKNVIIIVVVVFSFILAGIILYTTNKSKTTETMRDSLQISLDSLNLKENLPKVVPSVEIGSPQLYETGIPKSGLFSFNKYDTVIDGLKIYTSIDTLPYTEFNGKELFQGDIVIAERKEYDSVTAKAKTRVLKGIFSRRFSRQPISKQEKSQIYAVSEKALGKRWTNSTVYYSIDPNISTPRTVIENAISLWTNNVATIHFQQIDPMVNGNIKNYVEFVDGPGYSSDVGMVGGRQEITIGVPADVGKIAHEIGHVLGLWHEQSHPQRDTYIIVHTENLLDLGDAKKNENLKAQFIKMPAESVDVTNYDFASIMHYPANAFAKPGTITIEVQPVYKAANPNFGQRIKPSSFDIEQIKKLYK